MESHCRNRRVSTVYVSVLLKARAYEISCFSLRRYDLEPPSTSSLSPSRTMLTSYSILRNHNYSPRRNFGVKGTMAFIKLYLITMFENSSIVTTGKTLIF